MRIFKDKNGREWRVAITLGAAKNVRDLLNIDLLNPATSEGTGEDAPLYKLIQDDILVALVVAELLNAQLKERNVSTDEFLNDLDGECTARLTDVFFDEYSYFFSARGREFLVAALKNAKDALAKAATEAKAKIESLGAKSVIMLDEPELRTGAN